MRVSASPSVRHVSGVATAPPSGSSTCGEQRLVLPSLLHREPTPTNAPRVTPKALRSPVGPAPCRYDLGSASPEHEPVALQSHPSCVTVHPNPGHCLVLDLPAPPPHSLSPATADALPRLPTLPHPGVPIPPPSAH